MTKDTSITIPLIPLPAPRAERSPDPLEERTVSERTIYENHFIRMVEEQVILPGGEAGRRIVLPHRGACAIVAIDDEGNIIFERQWRHPLRRAFWEIPAGKIDPNEDEAVCAARELHEECGVKAKQWTKLGVINNAIGYSDEHIVIYLAQSLEIGEQALDPGEYLEIYRVPLAEAVAMCLDGRVTDVKTLVGVFWAQAYLAKPVNVDNA